MAKQSINLSPFIPAVVITENSHTHVSMSRVKYVETMATPEGVSPFAVFPPKNAVLQGIAAPNRLKLEPLDFPISEAMQINTVEEIEDYVIACATQSISSCPITDTTLETPITEPTYIGTASAKLCDVLRRHCDLIAARTRIGYGDMVLMNPKTIEKYLKSDSSSSFVESENPEEIGRWKQSGRIYNSVDIWAGEHLSDDQIIISGNKHSGPAMIIDVNGKLSVLIPEILMPGTFLGQIHDFVINLTIY